MQTILINGANFNLIQLMNELTAQVPTFRRVTDGAGDEDNGSVHGNRVAFADGIPAANVQAVIDAHVPKPPPTPRDFKADLRAIAGLNPSLVTWLESVLRLP